MVDWVAHKKHRDYMVGTTGQWAGLLNENGEPVCDLPPVVEIEGDTARSDLSELTLTVQARTPSGETHPIVDEIIARGLGQVDSQARLVPSNQPTRFVCIEREGIRSVYRVMFATAHGGTLAPSTVKIHAVTILDALQGLPAWSNPRSIDGVWRKVNQDFAVMWETQRELASVSMATRADGYTVHGAAVEMMKRIIDESMAATMKITGETDSPVVCEILPGAASPDVFIRPEDESVWETIVPIASAAGVEISGTMWLPGDPPLKSGATKPTVVVWLRQSERG